MENPKNEKLWRKAEQRVKFKKNLASYILVNAFLWAIWFFTRDHNKNEFIPWPAWASLGWGFALAMQYFRTYTFDKDDEVEKEYRKMVDEGK